MPIHSCGRAKRTLPRTSTSARSPSDVASIDLCPASREATARMRFSAWLLLALALSAAADEISDAKKRWAESPHGPLLERILPPSFEPAQLPEPGSAGAQL